MRIVVPALLRFGLCFGLALAFGCAAKKGGNQATDLASAHDGSVAGDLASPPGVDMASAHDLAGLDQHQSSASGKWSLGYYAGYEAGKYPVDAIEWSGLTHIAVAFYLPKDNGTLDKALFIDATNGPKLAKQLVDAAHANGKKAIISIGGADTGPQWLNAASDAHRATFVGEMVALLTDPGFDGIDLDWEPLDTSSASTTKLVKALVADLRAAAPTAILTMPVGYQNTNFPDDLSLFADLSTTLDQINLMTYGMAGAYPGWKSWHSSALYQSDAAAPTSVKSSIDLYIAAGVPKAKLGVGAGFYGLCYTPPVSAPLQALSTSAIVADDGTMSYQHIVTDYESINAANKHYDNAAKAPYLSFGSATGAQGCGYITYENPQSLTDKAAYIKDQGLGGLIIWTINQGYFATAAAGQKSPLLSTLSTALLQ